MMVPHMGTQSTHTKFEAIRPNQFLGAGGAQTDYCAKLILSDSDISACRLHKTSPEFLKKCQIRYNAVITSYHTWIRHDF